MVCDEFHWDTKITPHMWTRECKDAWKFVIDSIISDLALVHWDHRKTFNLQTDFYKKGMGFVGMQPANNSVSLVAMLRYMDGKP